MSGLGFCCWCGGEECEVLMEASWWRFEKVYVVEEVDVVMGEGTG